MMLETGADTNPGPAGAATGRTRGTPRLLIVGVRPMQAALMVTRAEQSRDRCSTPDCLREPVWPSVRRSKTWCQECLSALARSRGYEPEEPLREPTQRWLLRHLSCSGLRHSNLTTVRKAEPVCPHCRWTRWAEQIRPSVADTARKMVAALLAGDASTFVALADFYDHRYVWPAERVAAVFDSADAELLVEPADGDGLTPLPWRCRRCGYIDALPAERMQGESQASWLVCHACNLERLHRSPQPLHRYSSLRGLKLVSTPAKDRHVAYDASCVRCGTPRRVSVMTLTSGAPPCLRCDGQRLDPTAPHRVYLFAFTDLAAYKVGITHCADDLRLIAHQRIGGQLLEIVTLPNRATAVVAERMVLDRYRHAAAPAATTECFPQGGWTECWAMSAGHPDLKEVVKTFS